MIKYSRNSENLGLEKNAIKALEMAAADFVLWCGDDDFIADGYLEFLIRKIEENPNLGCVIPGLASLDQDGGVHSERVEAFEFSESGKGYQSVLRYSHLAHQMSGLMVRRRGLLEDYLRHSQYRNPYLFIYFAANCMLKYDAIYAPRYKTLVTTFNQKDWSYNDIGLLDEVFKNYFALSDQLNDREIDQLLLRFLVMHSYRLAFRPLKPALLLRQYRSLMSMGGVTGNFKRKATVLFVKEVASSLPLRAGF
jgi:glycosyltransferase involved in cell wall biosynthesis